MEAYIFDATCINVVDGDTIDCVIDLGFGFTSTHRLRLYGINSPELHSSNPEDRQKAQEAKSYVIKALVNQQLKIQTYKSDDFGRYLAKVFIPKNDTEYECLNDLLIQEGLAVEYMSNTGLL